VERITNSNKRDKEQKLNINLNLRDERHNFTSIETRSNNNRSDNNNLRRPSGLTGEMVAGAIGAQNYSTNLTPRHENGLEISNRGR
jgi:hypothetical protein